MMTSRGWVIVQRGYQFRLSMKMPSNVWAFARWLVARDDDLTGLALQCGGVDNLIHEAWIQLVFYPPSNKGYKWTSIWSNALKWAAHRRYKKLRKERFPPLADFLQNSTELVPIQDSVLLRDSIVLVLKRLLPREREIIQMRFGLEDGVSHTLKSIGRVMGISEERVRQIEERAIRKLQQFRSANVLSGFV